MGKKHSITGLATLAARTAVRNKIPNYDARRKDNLKKILYEKYTCCIDKSDIFGLKNNSNLDKKIEKLAAKAELKAQQNRIVKLQAIFQVSWKGNIFLVIMVFKMCLFITQYLILQLQKDKGIGCVIRWKSKGAYSCILYLRHTAFFYRIKRFRYKIRIKFYKDTSVVEQNNFTTNIVNADMSYDFESSLKNYFSSFSLKCCLFSPTMETLFGVFAMTLQRML